jgi:hypothetical protein
MFQKEGSAKSDAEPGKRYDTELGRLKPMLCLFQGTPREPDWRNRPPILLALDCFVAEMLRAMHGKSRAFQIR